jgi:hypothetical protein
MKSETSDIVNYLDKNGNKIDSKKELKRQSSDTDFHFNIVANKEKIIDIISEESSSINDIINSSDSNNSRSSNSSKSSNKLSVSSKKSSSSKPRIDNIDLNSPYSKNYDSMPKKNVKETNYTEKEEKQSYKNIPDIQPTKTAYMTPQEIRMKKIELLRKLSEVKLKGYSLTKEYDFNSTVEEMEYEYDLLKSFVDKRNGTKLYKNLILNGIGIAEFFNDKYNPFDFQLAGWSDHMSIEIDSYDDLIEELYEKYKSSGKSLPVEVRLFLFVFASGAAFHMSKTHLNNIPGASKMASSAISKMLSGEKKQSQFMSPQEINIENQKKELRQREKEQKEKLNNHKEQNYYTNNFESIDSTSKHNSLSRDIPNIKIPDEVNEILNRRKNNIEFEKMQYSNDTDTQLENTSTNNRLVSEATFSDSRKGRKLKKPIISINTN